MTRRADDAKDIVNLKFGRERAGFSKPGEERVDAGCEPIFETIRFECAMQLFRPSPSLVVRRTDGAGGVPGRDVIRKSFPKRDGPSKRVGPHRVVSVSGRERFLFSVSSSTSPSAAVVVAGNVIIKHAYITRVRALYHYDYVQVYNNNDTYTYAM